MQQQLVALMKQLAPNEGYNLTTLPGVRLLRANHPLAKTPVLYDPGVVIVCQGRKRGYLGDKCYTYDAQQYLAVSVPVPFTMETDASPEEPLLAIYIHLDFKLTAELILQIESVGTAGAKAAPESMIASAMSHDLQETVLRLLRALTQSPDAEILGPLILRELYYHFLTDEQGPTLRSALTTEGRFGEIGRVLQFIHQHYSSPLNLAALANQAGMSVPTLHIHFKRVTGTTPIQYIKSVRLHQARMLMVRQSMTAQESGIAVGYESSSQFNREFKRLFGLAPAQEAKRVRDKFAIPPIQEDAVYVSSH